MLIKKNIKYTGNDLNIQIPINVNLEHTGYQQEIDEFTSIKTNNSINDATDGEVFKFKYGSDNKKIEFTFDESLGGFTTNDITNESLSYLNSFYIFDFFDSISPNNQTKIFSTYLTNFNKDSFTLYEFSPSFQIYNLFIPIGYLDVNEIDNNEKYTAYCRFSFFNAKTGNIQIFYNEDNESKTTSEKIFVKTEFDLNNRTWRFISESIIEGSTLYLKELTDSQEYTERINNTIEKYDNLQQNYPDNTTFNYQTGKYINND